MFPCWMSRWVREIGKALLFSAVAAFACWSVALVDARNELRRVQEHCQKALSELLSEQAGNLAPTERERLHLQWMRCLGRLSQADYHCTRLLTLGGRLDLLLDARLPADWIASRTPDGNGRMARQQERSER